MEEEFIKYCIDQLSSQNIELEGINAMQAVIRKYGFAEKFLFSKMMADPLKGGIIVNTDQFTEKAIWESLPDHLKL